MRSSIKKLLTLTCSVVMAVGVFGVAACSGDPEEEKEDPTELGDVTGTYTIEFATAELSGNVRHSGYLAALQATETNTVVLKADNTYEYTKHIETQDPMAASAQAYSAAGQVFAAAPRAGAELFAWQSAGDGNCTLTFYRDGTYLFEYTTMGAQEEGTWTWQGWTLTVTTPGGNASTASMDADTNALNFHYVADMGGGMLTHDFTVGADVWGAAFGGQGNFTPEEGGDTQTALTYYYTGSGNKTTVSGGQSVSYDATEHVFLLDNDIAYIVEETETNSAVVLGEWTEDGGAVSVTIDGETTTADGDTISVNGIAVTLSQEIPAAYQDADWDQLVEDAQAPAASGPVVIEYVFTGTYTVDGDVIILNPATACTWSEDWGTLQNNGFTSGSGNEDDIVYPKGATGESYLPLDHFGGQCWFAPNAPADKIPTNNVAVRIEVDKDAGTFIYSTSSIFDE